MLKHAKASEVFVELKFLDDIFVMQIEDNGIGFNVDEKRSSTSSGSGVGLRSLYNRASIIGATISITSIEGSGTKTVIEMPYREDSI